MKLQQYNPDEDIPDLTGKVIFITGGTAGLGAQTARVLAAHHPEQILISGRDAERAKTLISEINASAPDVKITFVQCDLASLDSVKQAAQSLTIPRLDILICNAGISASPCGLTKDGYEVQFGTNHLGHALLIKHLLPVLNHTAETVPYSDVRIITLTSLAAFFHPTGGIVFKDLRTTQNFTYMGRFQRYGQSKLANLLYTTELARRYPKITSVSIHPGIVATDMFSDLSFPFKMLIRTQGAVLTPEEGAYNSLWAATSNKKKLVTGSLYEPVGVLSSQGTSSSRSEKLRQELWEWTEKALERY